MKAAAASPFVSIAWASCPRWAVRESADLVEVIEQPAGQTCAVLIDVQGTGASPRRLGQALLLEARSLMSGGVSPDLAAHAMNQHLHYRRDGQVGAAIMLVSVAPNRRRAEIAGYGDATIAQLGQSGWACQEMRGVLAGHDPGAGPDRRIVSLEDEAVVVVSSDGLARDAASFITLASAVTTGLNTAEIAAGLIAAAIKRDQGRPSADMASVAIRIAAEETEVAIERGEIWRPANARSMRP